jgi:hypothetical protein
MPNTRSLSLLLLAVAVWCVPDGYRKATVVKMAAVYTPTNLADSYDCQNLWGTIARFGVDMDNVSDDWNQRILTAAFDLIERGCVRDPAS